LKNLVPNAIKKSEKNARVNNGLIEYYGPAKPKTVLVAMGSLVGTIKDVIDEETESFKVSGSVGVLKIKTYRPFPAEEIRKIIKQAHHVAVIEKAVSLGATDGPLTLDIKACAMNHVVAKVQGYTVGLGGRDITKKMIKDIITDVKKDDDKSKFVGK
jgi:pyruvate ferredoxin oxidoreductase alpha subunit